MKSLDIMLQTSSFGYYSRVYFFCGVGLESPKTTFIWKLPAVIFSTNRPMRKVMIETTLLLFLSNMYLNLFPSSAIFTNSRSTLHFQWKYHLPVFKAFQSRSIFNILLRTTHFFIELSTPWALSREGNVVSAFFWTLSKRATFTQHLQCIKLLTDPSDALAPTLSPLAFQQTSKMPPVPR